MATFNVKCSVCGQVFEREAAAQPVGVSADHHDWPDHPGVVCVGTGEPTIVLR